MESSLEANSHLAKKFPTFMEPDGSLLCSQEPTTGLCPGIDKSSPKLPTLFL
jgi:hypothetical protein